MVEEFSECQFFNPVNSAGTFPEVGEYWNFASSTCKKNIDYLTLIKVGDARYFMDHRISYGEFFIVFFLLLFLCWGIFKALWGFVFPKFWKALSQRDL
jgi:hypothetical protein